MSDYLDADDKRKLDPPEKAFPSPIPTQVVSNGEFLPGPQNAKQREVEDRIKSIADDLGGKQGLSRRHFLKTAAGMTAAFVAMNEVYGLYFDAQRAEAATPELADARAQSLSGQFIVDPHTHYIHDNPRPNSAAPD